MANLLVEIHTEEIPARFCELLSQQLARSLTNQLVASRLLFLPLPTLAVKVFATYRRLAVLIDSIAVQQIDSIVLIKGPAESVAKDKTGAWTPAAHGFCRKQGVHVCDVEMRDGYMIIEKKVIGLLAVDLLSDILQQVLCNLSLPITMYWGDKTTPFIRAIHSIVVLLDNSVIPLKFGGIQSDRKIYGHRFLTTNQNTLTQSSGIEISLKLAVEYVNALKNAYVRVDALERKSYIRDQLNAATIDGNLILDEALLDEVTYLTEWPEILVGKFNATYLNIPQECLILTMQKNQKYFPVVNNKGKLINQFVIVADNVTQQNRETIINGNVKVLSARLNDAHFFYIEDCKHALDYFAEKLDKVVFLKEVGSYADKIKRLHVLTMQLSEKMMCTEKEKQHLQCAVSLCKADLTTHMVIEFPELQGIMGHHYALVQGQDPEVAQAIIEHYQPKGPDDQLPMGSVSLCLALAEKMDTIVACFLVGRIPTGSKDPYALRRHGAGIIKILFVCNFPMTLDELILAATPTFSIIPSETFLATINDFFAQRIKTFLKETLLIPYDQCDALMAAGFLDVADLKRRQQRLNEICKSSSSGIIIQAAIRCKRIAKDVLNQQFLISSKWYEDPIEHELGDYLNSHKLAIVDQEIIDQYCQLALWLDVFFEKVMVMTNHPERRQNRLAICQQAAQWFMKTADFEKLVIS